MAVFVESFIFGAANSLHCTLMCGPLAACIPGARRGIAAYHGTRILGYAIVGAVAGTIGGTTAPTADTQRAIPFVLASLLVLMALGIPARAIGLRGSNTFLRRALSWSSRHGPVVRSALLGSLTPLLPCGLLYAAAGTALLAGSPTSGATAMAGFALVPLPRAAMEPSRPISCRSTRLDSWC